MENPTVATCRCEARLPSSEGQFCGVDTMPSLLLHQCGSCLLSAWCGRNECITKDDARSLMWQACGEQARTKFVGYGQANTASLTELLASFFVLCHTAVQRWSRERSTGLRYMPPLHPKLYHQIHRLCHSSMLAAHQKLPSDTTAFGVYTGGSAPPCMSQPSCLHTAFLSVTD